jgi:predicted N-acetyltransferase YhbS
MNNKYSVRRAQSEKDSIQLRDLFNEVFFPEKVGVFAETIFHHLPRMEKKFWFMVEEEATSKIVSAFALIPWVWEYEGVKLKVAEMGVVGTLERYRGRGFMRMLNQEFEQTFEEEQFDISVIQGIPGFYNHFGYYYAVELENHIDVPLFILPNEIKANFTFRLCDHDDVAFLLKQDEIYRQSFSISSYRDQENWHYLLSDSLKTEYGSEFWIVENSDQTEKYYCRVPQEGFGHGLIVSEVSEDITQEAFTSLFVFLKEKAQKQEKPYIRLNLHNESNAAKMAISMGAKIGRPYAWQVKVPNKVRFLEKIKPILEKRVNASAFRNYSGILRLDLFKESVDLGWEGGRLISIKKGNKEEVENTFCIPTDLFPALSMGYKTWRELQAVRPDIFPSNQYLRMKPYETPDESGLFIDILFPKSKSWVYEQY